MKWNFSKAAAANTFGSKSVFLLGYWLIDEFQKFQVVNILSTTFFISKRPENIKHAITVADGSCWLSQWKDIRRKTLSRSADIILPTAASLSLLCQVLDCWAPAISTRSQLGSLGIRLIRALYIGKEMKSIEERGTASTPTLITSFHVSAKRERNRRRRGWAFGPPISL